MGVFHLTLSSLRLGYRTQQVGSGLVRPFVMSRAHHRRSIVRGWGADMKRLRAGRRDLILSVYSLAEWALPAGRGRARGLSHALQPIVAKVPRVPFTTVTSREENVHHLASRHEVHSVPSAASFPKQILEELLHGRAGERSGITRVHAMAMELYEDPIRPAFDGHGCSEPQTNAIERRGAGAREFGIFDARDRPLAESLDRPDGEWPLDDEWKCFRGTSHAEICPAPMRSPVPERDCTFVHAVDLRRLSAIGRRGKGEIGVAACLGEDLHLLIDSAKAPPRRICERPVSVYEAVKGGTLSLPSREAPMARQSISELNEGIACMCRAIWLVDAVMQMDLDFTPAPLAMTGQALDHDLAVLLRREEVGVHERSAVVISIRARHRRICRAPMLEPSLLFLHARVRIRPGARNDGGLEMVGHRDDEVHWPSGGSPPADPLPAEGRHPPQSHCSFRELLSETCQLRHADKSWTKYGGNRRPVRTARIAQLGRPSDVGEAPVVMLIVDAAGEGIKAEEVGQLPVRVKTVCGGGPGRLAEATAQGGGMGERQDTIRDFVGGSSRHEKAGLSILNQLRNAADLSG